MNEKQGSRPRAKRMSPEQRRNQILDTATKVMLACGHSNCSLEEIAAEAGVSTPLIYKYFSRREELVSALLSRELGALKDHALTSRQHEKSVGSVARQTIDRALRYYDRRGPILAILARDSAVLDDARTSNNNTRSNTTEYFIERCVKDYELPLDIAMIAVSMVVNAPIHSMAYLKKRDVPLDTTIEVWQEFVAGGWRALREKYGRPPGTQTNADLPPDSSNDADGSLVLGCHISSL